MKALKKWVVGAGIFNIVAAFPLAMPFTVQYFYALFDFLNRSLSLGGLDFVLPINANNMLLINTCGLALALVGLMLLYASGDLKNRIGVVLLNGTVRIVFALLVLYYVFAHDISRILLTIAFIDTVIGSMFFYYWHRSKEQ